MDQTIVARNGVSEEIPRNYQVQDQSRPLVEKQGKKRKSGTDPESQVDQDSPAELKLLEIRDKFVQRVSKAVLKQLLDYLEKKSVLNNSEREEIDEVPNRGDKARSLIDAVRRKGNEACKVFIRCLQVKDPTSSNLSGLSSAPSAPPGTKRKGGTCPKAEKRRMSSDELEKKHVSDSDSSEDKTQDGDPENPQPEKQKLTSNLRKTVKDSKISGDLGQKLSTVKVVQKSNSQKYINKKKEQKFSFFLGVADETDAIKVQVYGSERYPAIEEGRCYTFRDVLMDRQKLVKVTERTTMSKTGPFDIPKNVESEAGKLIYSPVYSIREVQTLDGWKEVSVEGTVKTIGDIKPIKMKAKRMKKNKSDFEVEDDTGSIRISLWGEDTKHSDGISVGDVVRINNLSTNHYNNTVSSNSTDSTRTIKVQSATVQKATIMINGIIQFGRIFTESEVSMNDQSKKFEVPSPLSAEGFGLNSEDGFEDKLLQSLPCQAEAEIQGNKIQKLKAAA